MAVQTTRCTSPGSGGSLGWSLYLFCATELVREDCGGGTDYSLYQSWQWRISGLVIIHLFCATELVREDCGGGTDYSLYQSWQWRISGLVLYISSLLQSWYGRTVAGVQTTRCTSPGSGGSQGLYYISLLCYRAGTGGLWRGYRLLAVPVLAVADLRASNYISLLCYRAGTRGLWRGYKLLAVPVLAVADLRASNYSSLLCYRAGTGGLWRWYRLLAVPVLAVVDLRACIIYLFFATELVREDCGGGTDYSLYQSWQWWFSVFVIILLFCAPELVRVDCGGGTDYCLYQSW